MNINKKWSTLIGSILIHFTLGSLLTFGNFSPYLTSYLRELTGSTIRYTNVIWIFSSNSISFGISSVIIGQIIAKFKPSLKLIIFLGCMIMSTSVAVTYFTVQHSFLMTLLTYGCLNGISNGFTYSTCLSVTMKWFPESKGFSNT